MAIHERVSRVRQVMDSLSRVAETAPTILYHFQDLAMYHPPSGNHVEGVTFGLADTAISLGLDPDIATLCALPHDIGKRHVRLEALDGKLPKKLIRMLVREPHMEWTRIPLIKIDEKEFVACPKADALAITMSHHDVLPNTAAGDYYPRHRTIIEHPKRELRRTIPKPLLRWQILLTLQDKAHRFGNGYNNDKQAAYSTIQTELHSVLSNERLPFDYEELDRMVNAVATSTCALRTEELKDAHTLLMKQPSR